jgi:hypothetical protein
MFCHVFVYPIITQMAANINVRGCLQHAPLSACFWASYQEANRHDVHLNMDKGSFGGAGSLFQKHRRAFLIDFENKLSMCPNDKGICIHTFPSDICTCFNTEFQMIGVFSSRCKRSVVESNGLRLKYENETGICEWIVGVSKKVG